MIGEVARLHVRALPQTMASRRGVKFVEWLYRIVLILGFVRTASRNGKIVGAISGISSWILTLVVDPEWQRKGIGRELIAGLGGRRYVYTETSSVGFYQKQKFKVILRAGKTIFLCRK